MAPSLIPDHPVQYRTINGLKVRYREHVRAGAPCLLMTNAWPQSIRCWDSSWDSLAGDYHLLAIDMPGFGLSQGQPGIMTPSAQGRFFVDVLDTFGLDAVHGIGPDVGVPAMLHFAQHYPDRVRSLVIFDGPGYYPPQLSWTLKAITASSAVRQLVAPFGNIFAFEAMRRGYRRFRPSKVALAEYRKVNGLRGSFSGTLNYLASYPTELSAIGNGLARMETPTLVCWGEEDPFLAPQNAKELHKRIPRSELYILSGCGHFSHEDAGYEFVSLLNDWINRQEPGLRQRQAR